MSLSVCVHQLDESSRNRGRSSRADSVGSSSGRRASAAKAKAKAALSDKWNLVKEKAKEKASVGLRGGGDVLCESSRSNCVHICLLYIPM